MSHHINEVNASSLYMYINGISMVSLDHKYTNISQITAVVTILTVKDDKLGTLLCILHILYLQPTVSGPNTWYSSVIPKCPSRLSF